MIFFSMFPRFISPLLKISRPHGAPRWMCSSSLPQVGSYKATEIAIPVHWGEVRGRLWEEDTPGPKKTIFGLHGWMDNAGTMNGIGPHLPPGYKFYVFDQPGCGFSSPCADAWGYNYAHIAVWIKHLKETLGLRKEQISIIAFSLGSTFAQAYACAFPTDVERLVQIDMLYAPFQPIEHVFIGLSFYVRAMLKLKRNILSEDKLPPEYSYEEALTMYRGAISQSSGDNALTEESTKILLERGMELTPSGTYKWRHDPRIAIKPPNNLTQELMFMTARTLRGPVMVIKSTDSKLYLDSDQTEKFLSIQRQNNPHFQYVEVEGGHYVHLNHPERVLPHIQKFFSPEKEN